MTGGGDPGGGFQYWAQAAWTTGLGWEADVTYSAILTNLTASPSHRL